MEQTNDGKFFLVEIQDEVVQLTTYVVRANNSEMARDLVTQGRYLFESAIEIMDTLNSEIKKVEEIK